MSCSSVNARPTDIAIDSVSYEFEDFLFRTPLKFGGVPIDRVTLLHVHCQVRDARGRSARGFGSMPLGNVWSFPSRQLTYDQTLSAMKELVGAIAARTRAHTAFGHPIEITSALEPDYFRDAVQVSERLCLPEPIPPLCTLVTASPFDAALHDAYGKLHRRNCFRTYGREFLPRDLGSLLHPDSSGEYLDQYVLTSAKKRMPLYHLVGALDPLEAQDLIRPKGDVLPETLEDWIPFNGLTHLKIKLNGDDLNWDVERVVRVERVAQRAQARQGVNTWHYSLDFNERCPNVDYLLEFLNRLRSSVPAAYARIQYIEQPTARDLKANRSNLMHEASRLRPVVIDESLIDLDSLLLAKEMGYTGVALKACKGQTQSLLMAAAAQKFGMFLCVQDLTCPGASLLHSASLAAHIPGVAAIEANARQYVPAANADWVPRFPGIFQVTDGTLETGLLDGPGLGIVPA